MTGHAPPGWPAAVPPPDAPGWQRAAGEWLIDLCPADFRRYPVLRRHPLALAWLAGRHVDGARQAMARALGQARADLAELPPGAVEETLLAVEREQARLLAAARGVELIDQALRGHRFVPRL